MIKTGAKMIGLTLLSAVAAIIVGLIGSLVAATVGKTCGLDNMNAHWNSLTMRWKNSLQLH